MDEIISAILKFQSDFMLEMSVSICTAKTIMTKRKNETVKNVVRLYQIYGGDFVVVDSLFFVGVGCFVFGNCLIMQCFVSF